MKKEQILRTLVNIADYLDKNKMSKEASEVDLVINKVAQQNWGERAEDLADEEYDLLGNVGETREEQAKILERWRKGIPIDKPLDEEEEVPLDMHFDQ